MKIAVFSDSINIPPKEGINVHTYDLLLSFARRSDCTPVLVVCDRGWLSHDILREQPFDTILIPESQFYDVAFISSFLKRHSFDIAQSYMTYFGALVLGPASFETGIPCVAELHDLEESVVGVYFARDEIAQATRDHTEFQQQASQYASVVRVMSRHDFGIISSTWSNYDANRYIWMPVSQMIASLTSATDPQRVLYIGNMSYAPNAEGAEIIQQVIAPSLRDIPFTFIGRGSERYVSESIESLGMVDDIEPYLSETAIGLAPILRGSGMKIKNLTYLSHGIPLITTTLGAQGYPRSEAIIIEDDFTRWPEIVRDLLRDNVRRQYLSGVAREYFKANFDLDRNTEKLMAVYRRAIDEYDEHRGELLNPVNALHAEIDLKHVYWLRELREAGVDAVSEETIVKGNQ